MTAVRSMVRPFDSSTRGRGCTSPFEVLSKLIGPSWRSPHRPRDCTRRSAWYDLSEDGYPERHLMPVSPKEARKHRRSSGQLAGSLVDLKQHLKRHVALGLVAIFIVMSTWIGLVIWGSMAGPTVDATDIVTIVEYVDGSIGKHQRRFRHLVRTPGGAEYRMTFGELYPAGTRLSVSYRRFTRGDTIKVMFYSRVPD